MSSKGSSPWLTLKHDVQVFKINIFNLDPINVCQKKLKSIAKAIVKDSWKNYSKDYSSALDIDCYHAHAINDASLFKGDRIPVFISELTTLNSLGYHALQTPPDNQSFIIGNNNITQTLGLTIPNDFPNFTPYVAVFSAVILNLLKTGYYQGNPYAYSKPSDFYDLLSFVLSHELHEVMGDDSQQNWDLFDNTAPTTANWKYAIYDANGNCTNGIPPTTPGGFVTLPSFSDLYPQGYLVTLVQENGDSVSRGSAAKLQSYTVEDHAISNYPTSTYWKPYYVSSQIKYDHKGLVKLPCQPYAGLHNYALILDLSTTLSKSAVINNYGPVTSQQLYGNIPSVDPTKNNFPPDYTIVSFLTGPSGGLIAPLAKSQ
jgi:hypothetical protein